MAETWIDVKGYEGLYQVSNLGNVKSLGNDKKRKEKILIPSLNNKGYQKVNLCKNGKDETRKVHRLVAEHFIPNPDNLPQVNHRDEDKTNNCVNNLEWCDAAYNNKYGTRTAKTSKPIIQYTKDGQFVAEFPSTMEAARQTGVSVGNICSCCKGNPKYSHAGGYIWRYKE